MSRRRRIKAQKAQTFAGYSDKQVFVALGELARELRRCARRGCGRIVQADGAYCSMVCGKITRGDFRG